jgi:hypothetical protein
MASNRSDIWPRIYSITARSGRSFGTRCSGDKLLNMSLCRQSNPCTISS